MGYRFFITSVWYCSTFLIILPLLCNRLKYSMYYGVLWDRNITEENLRMREENDKRLMEAKQEFRNIMKSNEVVREPNNFTDVVITLITVSRERGDYNPYYLIQTVSKLLKRLRKDASKLDFTYGVMVCNVDSLPNEYTEAKEISKFIHTTVKYTKQPNKVMNRFEKEKQDYVYCLQKSLQFQPKYVLLMEDDAYPKDQMLLVLEYGIYNIFEEKYSEFFHRRRKVAYLKLYHPERLLGFLSAEVYRLFELAGAIILICMSSIVPTRTFRSRISWNFLIQACIYVVFLAFAIGRPNLLGIRTLSPYFHSFVNAPSCCTPANLYTYKSAKMVIDSMSGKVCYPGHAKDVLLDEFLGESGYSAIYVEPNIFKHIGQYSSLRQGRVLDPYVV
ncbi:transmembrane protein 246-like [Dendronephthya gigantea]|uniref:transmembrane protein 246-like n=1 Tax=Dendronephthya gigantea TaxID=151771 RepID=UPI0010691D74|nr:transmembrane protein 246-like [Dendronephthya gigantea]